MNLPFKKLTSFTCSNQLSGIFERYRLVKPLSKGFSYQILMRDMGPIDSSMDVVEQTNALGLCDAFENNPITTPFIEDTVDHCIKHGFMASSFHVYSID